VGVALMSNAIPYALDMVAMRHLPPAVLGVLMSASPAVSALAGWWVLGETLSGLQMAGVACITAACAGAVGRPPHAD
jgi:inner membrane transporter RhtA